MMIGETDLQRSFTAERASGDPLPKISGNLGESVAEARRKIDDLTRILRHIDEHRDRLSEHGIEVVVDLGPIGNAAAAVRRDVEKKNDRPVFQMPTAPDSMAR